MTLHAVFIFLEPKWIVVSLFFLEHAGELRIIILIEKRVIHRPEHKPTPYPCKDSGFSVMMELAHCMV